MIKIVLNTFAFTAFLTLSAGAQVQLVSDFTFDGNLTDTEGNGNMTLMNGANYSYNNGVFTNGLDSTGAAPGLKVTLPDALFDEQEYTIQIDFSFSQTSGYRKVADFMELTSDYGLYINDQLRLYSAGGYGPTTIALDSMISVVLVRSNALDSAWVYLTDGASRQLESAATDVSEYFVASLNGTDRVMHFFHDDTLTASEFSNSFSVDRIRIWNGMLATGVGITEKVNNSFVCFPNPASSITTVQFNQPATGEVQLMTTDGRVLNKVILNNSSEVQFGVDQLSEGMYLIRYNNEVITFCKK